MIFYNPSGAPELACDECGCRWFDRMTDSCYECGSKVTPEQKLEFQRALETFQAGNKTDGNQGGQAPCNSKTR